MTWQELCTQTKEDMRRDGNYYVHKHDSIYYTLLDRGCEVQETMETFADELKRRLVSKIGEPYKYPETIINEMLNEVGVER